MPQVNRGLSKKNIVILRRLANTIGLTIPAHILRELKWKEGDIIKLTINDKILELRKGTINFED